MICFFRFVSLQCLMKWVARRVKIIKL
jgi:hypothetical protein